MRTPIAILRRPDRLSRLWLVRDPEPRLEETPVDGALASQLTRMARFDVERDVDTLRALWRDTLPAPDGWPGRPPPAAVAPKPPPRPTAAHPRAFRGTKRQPPKQERPRIDLRPLLDRAAAVRAAGVAFEADSYLEAHHGGDGDLDALDPRFRAWVLPSLSGLPWRDVEAAHGRFETLIRAWPDAATELAAVAAAGGLARWDGVISRLATSGRGWLRLLSARPDLARLDVDGVDAGLARVEALGEFEERAAAYLDMVARGASGAYAASGLELAALSPHFTWSFEDALPGLADGAALLPLIGAEAADEPWTLRAGWRGLGEQPQVARLYRATAALPPARRVAWVQTIAAIARPGPMPWPLIHPLLSRAVVDPFVSPEAVWRCLCTHEDSLTPARLKQLFELVHQVGDRNPDVAAVLSLFTGEVPTDPGIVNALEAAVAREVDACCLYRAVPALDAAAPAFTRRVLASHPKALFRVSLKLGWLHPDRAIGVVKAALCDPDARFPSTEAQWAAALRVPERRRDPFSRALREHHAGRRILRAGQLERHEARARARWDLAVLDVLERHIWADLSRSLEGAEWTDAVEHGAALLAGAVRNRRGLRRLLRACLRGDRGWVERHPASQRWLARHAALDRSKWRQGIALERGGLRLAFELDPLETLRLGTYVGSCLSLGAILSDDAAAVALDVNKRVVYARDADGRVVARQLVALSEDDALVCFQVYPYESPEPIQRAFAEYDRALAEHLGVPIHREDPDGPGDSYEIASVLSASFWDDGAWDLEPVTG